jgi:SAM-dependent methyltransferase
MAKVSLWYMHPRLYDLGMLLINGSFYLKIYNEIAARIPEKSSVLDIGAGPCTLQRYLKNCTYEAWDTNPHFVNAVLKKGIHATLIDAVTADIPKNTYDYIVLSGVLHHIHPYEKELMKKCLAAAKTVIVVEPFANPKKETRKLYRFLRNIRRKTFLERWIGEYDGRNHPDTITIHAEEELRAFLDSFGKNTKTYIGDEIITVYTK